MKRLAPILGLALALTPSAARAGMSGLSVEAGPVFLTKSGKLTFGTSSVESDAGVAIRGRVRLGMRLFSIAGEAQGSSQDYGSRTAGAPENLNATFVGVNAAFHPISVLRLTPYAEFGVGKLKFSDERIENDGRATHFGLGTHVSLTDKVGVEIGLRLQRNGDLKVQGLTQDFKYDPKLFSVLLTIGL